MLAAGVQDFSITAPATPEAKQWHGWGTALKPALEPITVARKPLVGTVAANVLRHGTGAINVDGCRVAGVVSKTVHGVSSRQGEVYGKYREEPQESDPHPAGRWPANLIHDGSDEVVGLFPNTTSGSRKAGRHVVAGGQGRYGEFAEGDLPEVIGDSGSAARFFYCAKASKADRDEGCDGLEERGRSEVYGTGMNAATKCDLANGHTPASVEARPLRRNIHPTVKPTALMRYLCRLVTPPNGIVLDPFMGSGSTGKAAILEGFRFLGIEREADYIEIARARIEAASREAGLFGASMR
jgi:site-specific DNA-methyltransferase (adenine-specific)